MFTATFYFLGAAAFILAASVCLSAGKRSDQSVEVDLPSFRVALVCLSVPDEKPAKRKKTRRAGAEPLWMQWYARCQEKAIQKRDALFSWTRTLALCSSLCIVGVLLEVEFDEPITVSRILDGFRLPRPIAIVSATPQSHVGQNAITSTLPANLATQK